MKIAILADPLDNQNAGVHIYTKSLVTELLKRNDLHEYLLVRQQRDPELKGVEQIIVPNINLPLGVTTFFRLFIVIPYLLRKKKVDVVFEPAHFGPFNLPRFVKRITFIHDLTPIKFPQYHRWHSQLLQRIFLESILKKADFIFTNSQNTSKDLEYYYPGTKGKNKSILLGKENIYLPTYDENLIRKLNIHRPFFLTVGTIEPRKNGVRLLQAFEKFVTKHGPGIDLVFAGGMGWKSKEFKQTLAQHPYKDHILLLGYVKKQSLPILYTHSTALIYPSLYEGFGFPVLEAMACGAPVICSNTSSLPEVGGTVAHYINSESIDQIEAAMAQVSTYDQKQRQHIHEKSLQHAAQFSWKKHADEFIKVIEGL